VTIRQNEEGPSDPLVDRLISTAIERGERARTRRIGAYGAATFAVAMLALGVAFYNPTPDTTARVVDAELGQTKVTRLAYESTVDRPETTVLVTLSNHLDLVGHIQAPTTSPGRRRSKKASTCWSSPSC